MYHVFLDSYCIIAGRGTFVKGFCKKSDNFSFIKNLITSEMCLKGSGLDCKIGEGVIKCRKKEELTWIGNCMRQDYF